MTALRERIVEVLSLGNSANTLIEYAPAGEKALRIIPEILQMLDAEGDGGAVDEWNRPPVTSWMRKRACEILRERNRSPTTGAIGENGNG
ncbi:hypothetical protein EAH75_01240 [Rhodanobacter glycinis]|uniref:hypothetical protein n=1 Tax=Rhodanobacter glycinis TaxID=582702 RepID=UPI00112A2CEB|nr:hypothetical protein [Rhodanobacter glycinis]TPG50151.1 hypothetical protein EAH75_01240 [Rhodanobacter glycinis]